MKRECAKRSGDNIALEHRLRCNGFQEEIAAELLNEDGRGIGTLLKLKNKEENELC